MPSFDDTSMDSLERHPETVDDWCRLVDDAIRSGELLVAYDYANRGLESHPHSWQLQYQAILALARSGATERALEYYQSYGLPAIATEDVLSLHARLAKDLARQSHGSERRRMHGVAAKAYADVFERTGGYYPAINAATMYFFAGQQDKAGRLALRAAENAREGPPSGAGDAYYRAATEAEAALLLDDVPRATEALERAARTKFADLSAWATTRHQLSSICDARRIPRDILAPIAPPAVIHFTGHRIAAPGRAGRFPAGHADAVAREIKARLDDLNVGFGYGSLANGADILFAEALLDRGAQLHVILPFDVNEFKRLSVSDAGDAWCHRFDDCLRKAKTVSKVTEDEYLGDDELFAYGSRFAMGLALLRAAHLSIEPIQLAVWDGQQIGSPAGTGIDTAYWQGMGLRSEIIAPGAEPTGSVTSPAVASASSLPEAVRLKRSVRAILFGDVRGFGSLRERQIPLFNRHVMGTVKAALDNHGDQVCYENSWGDAIFVVLREASAAAECGLEIQQRLKALDLPSLGLPDRLSMRLAGHFGPIFKGHDYIRDESTFFGVHVTRTARLEPVTPAGQVFITEPFAAALACEARDKFACEYVGRLPAAKAYGRMRMFSLRRRG